MKISLALVALVLALNLSCSRKALSDVAVRQGIERYLSSRPNLNMRGMDMQVTGVKVRGDQAEAEVTFRAKNDAKATMSMHYSLRRRGQTWEVEPQNGGHGGMAPPAESAGPGTPELPPGHPRVKTQ